jgi:hypothetical protein
MILASGEDKNVDLGGMINRYSLNVTEVWSFLSKLQERREILARTTSIKALIKSSLNEAKLKEINDQILRQANVPDSQKSLLTAQDDVKLQAAGIHAMVTKESKQLRALAEKNVLSTALDVAQNVTVDELVDLIVSTRSSFTNDMLERHNQVGALVERSLTALKDQKDRFGKIVMKSQIKDLVKQGATMDEATKQMESMIPGVRKLGGEYISPGDSCAAISAAGDNTDGKKWVRNSDNVSSYYAKKVYCLDGFDLIGKAGPKNTRPFTFRDEIDTHALLNLNNDIDLAQFDVSSSTKLEKYLVQWRHLDGSRKYLKPSCSIASVAEACTASCPCEASNDGSNFYRGTTADAIPLASVLVLVKPL